ncbi:peptidase M14 [Alicyclobacillus hesperidum]|uniref:Peptidase M14 n=1 Tax=Alicyclobacillus hesperidum TaxID=89784 RepID=A0AA37U1Y2_9BACL|nr:M14 family metallopeptidase [Alicyclobacillus hesperidum]GLV14433.1 peptidase M14 [Alicyclobacillus hesperidum]
MQARYWTHDEMWAELRRLEAANPQLMRVEVIGQSRQGRDIAAVTLTDADFGNPEDKAAVLVDANIHAGEVSGNAVAMYWIQWCIEQYGQDPEATELLRSHTVYVIPRIAVDGAELYLTTPARFRSSPHLYPHSQTPDGFVEDDVDGDGRVLMMRVPAEDGGYAIDEVDPRIMRPRRPGEFGGKYYHVFPEGRIDRVAKTGSLPALPTAKAARRHGMDFNRNFPIRWAGETGQRGAGPYPLSEPELRALADFVHRHPNISAYAALHTSGGVILRQPSTGDDAVLSEVDRALFTQVAKIGEQVSGYFSGSNYEKFATGHEKVLMPGAADDWMYDHLGVLSFTIEIWDLDGRAGARGYGQYGMRALLALSPEEILEDERKVYAYVTREFAAEGYFDWKSFDHPDFGPVEIGGLDPKFIIQNPPLRLLPEECQKVSAFLTKLGLSTAKLTITSVSCDRVADGVYRIVGEAANAGFLPTSSTDKGKQLLLEGIRAELSGSYEMIAGASPQSVGHLDGYGVRSRYAPPAQQRGYAEWLIRAAAGTELTVSFAGPRAGRVSQVIRIEG